MCVLDLSNIYTVITKLPSIWQCYVFFQHQTTLNNEHYGSLALSAEQLFLHNNKNMCSLTMKHLTKFVNIVLNGIPTILDKSTTS